MQCVRQSFSHSFSQWASFKQLSTKYVVHNINSSQFFQPLLILTALVYVFLLFLICSPQKLRMSVSHLANILIPLSEMLKMRNGVGNQKIKKSLTENRLVEGYTSFIWTYFSYCCLLILGFYCLLVFGNLCWCWIFLIFVSFYLISCALF